MEKINVFISSVQSEFAEERKALVHYIREDYMLGKFFVPFIFEELPAINMSAQEAYLSEVSGCHIYLGVFGAKYGNEDENGVSPTEQEYQMAAKYGKHRLIFIKQVSNRDVKEYSFIHRVEKDVVRRSFGEFEELKTAVYASLVRYLEEKEILRLLPWDASFHPTATLSDIDEDKVSLFVDQAHNLRGFPLKKDAGINRILAHLDLLSDKGRLTNAALLLFAKKPQKFFLPSEVKCVQFYGDEVSKPIPTYQVFHGSIFEMIDQAVGFVMSRINTSVSDRSQSVRATVRPEIPLKVVTEAIVNACTHRDYSSNGSVQVMLFRNRLEIWNPGTLPYGLTPAKLLQQHTSMPVNPTLANPLYLAGYIERIGSGTIDMLAACRANGLRDPEFSQESEFKVTIWRTKTHIAEDETHIAEDKTHIAEDETHIAEYQEKIKTLKAKQKSVIAFCDIPKTSREIIAHLGIEYQARAVKRYVTDLVAMDLLRPIILDKPNSPHQKYVAVQCPMDENI